MKANTDFKQQLENIQNSADTLDKRLLDATCLKIRMESYMKGRGFGFKKK